MTIQGCTFRALGKIRAVRVTELRNYVRNRSKQHISLRPTGLHLSEGTIFFHTSAGGLHPPTTLILPGPIPSRTSPALSFGKGALGAPGALGGWDQPGITKPVLPRHRSWLDCGTIDPQDSRTFQVRFFFNTQNIGSYYTL